MAANVTVCRNYNSSDYTEIASIFLNPLPQINSIEDDESETHDWSRSGYNFLGWNTERDGAGTMKQPGEAAATPYVYFAQWQEVITTPDIVISYNNSTITSLSDSGIVVLDTAGKLVNNNITIEYTKSGGGQSGGGDSLASLIQRTITSASDSTITTIGSYAFADCSKLINISFPQCTTIGSYAFMACHSLTIASFPACTTIGSSAFLGCNNLITASFPSCTFINSHAFIGCYSLNNIFFPQCSAIYGNAFYSCENLTTASFPLCTTIGSYVFRGCINLTTLSFPLCTSISDFTFASCNKLLTAVFPSCTTISTCAFQSCQSLTMVSFPMCARISSSAFRNCYNLLSFYVLTSSVPTLASTNVFSSTPIWNYTTSTGGEYGSIFVKASMLSAFQTATNWSVYSARMVGLTDAQIAALGI